MTSRQWGREKSCGGVRRAFDSTETGERTSGRLRVPVSGEETAMMDGSEYESTATKTAPRFPAGPPCQHD